MCWSHLNSGFARRTVWSHPRFHLRILYLCPQSGPKPMPRTVQETRGECLFLDFVKSVVFQDSDANGHAKGRVKGHAKGRVKGRSSLNIDAWPQFQCRKPILLSKAFTSCTFESRAPTSVNYWALQTDYERTNKANWNLCISALHLSTPSGKFQDLRMNVHAFLIATVVEHSFVSIIVVQGCLGNVVTTKTMSPQLVLSLSLANSSCSH